MSWYSTPLQPLDPVVVSQQPKPPFRYLRDNFAATGQNSYVKAPAQDQSMWQALTNIMPITQGVLNPRWGYEVFATSPGPYSSTVSTIVLPGHGLPRPTLATVTVSSTTGLVAGQAVTIMGNSSAIFNSTWTVASILSSTQFTMGPINSGFSTITGTGGTADTTAVPWNFNRLYDFQSDSLGTRTIIATGLPNILGLNENGTIYNGSIFVPSAASGIIRSITSRNYQYFCDGDNTLNGTTHQTGDSLKWNGAVTGGVSNIGILANDTTANTSSGSAGSNLVGPNSPTLFNVIYPYYATWTNPGGFGASSGTAETVLTSSNNSSNQEFCTDFNFSLATTETIAGIQLSITAYASTAGVTSLYFGLTQNGTTSTGGGFNTTPLTQTPTTYTVGGPTALWGTSWTASQIINNTFGAIVEASGWSSALPGGLNQIYADNLQLTIFLANTAGGATSSGGGVGIVSIATDGVVSLALGRTYYLVANNSSTGHFSDLSPPSVSTGTISDDEMVLLLATFNDPQVDYKYLLATADGGDPSILYEVSPIVPGLTISSWSINGSNVATFTGTWTGTPYTAGATFTVGGLVHGAYLNSLTGWTVTSTGTNTLVATVPGGHSADSATEIGVAGNTSFAIPNSVGLVVDNTPDSPLTVGSITYGGLVDNQALLYTDQFGNEYGVTLNDPPPAGNILLKHQGRLWMSGVPGATHSVFFSKSVTELTLPDGFIAGKYEEAWPGNNYFDVSDGAESVAGLLTDGTTLYIGTQNHIRRLIGNAPSNFQEPQIVHPEVGLLCQEVWQTTFMQGAPSGCIWMTPDFKVIQSDFNTYVDIGTPIQDILNAIQPTAQTLAHAAYVADGEYDLYILAVPYLQTAYCDLHLVFDLRARQWFVWKPAGGSLALMYNITQAAASQWLFITGAANVINIYDEETVLDNGTLVPLTATTTWMHMGEATRRKVLNEVQVYGDTAMAMSIYGANNLQDFTSTSRPIVYNRALRQSPFGTWNLYLTGDRAKHRYYQFTFSSETGRSPFLGSYAISATPLDDL
jgi:hypothetical protein